MLKNIPFLTSNNEILMINDQNLTQEINKRTSQRLKLKEELKRKNEMNKTRPVSVLLHVISRPQLCQTTAK